MKELKYSCPHCAQKSNRRYNMKVHIARRHIGVGIPICDRNVSHPALVSQYVHYNPSKFYFNNLLRRFLPVSTDVEVRSINPHYSFSDPFQSSLHLWDRMTKCIETSNNFLAKSYASRQKFNSQFPPTNQLNSMQLFDSLRTNHSLNTPLTIVHKYEQTSNTLTIGEEIRGFHVDVCQNCLESYSISVCGGIELTQAELVRRITNSLHHCSNTYSKVSNLSIHDKQIRHINLVYKLQQFILNKVQVWLQGEKPYLRAFKFQAVPAAGCVRFVKSVSDPFGFINRVIENGCTTMEDSELRDFLLLSRYRSTAIYASIRPRYSKEKYSDSCYYGILIARN